MLFAGEVYTSVPNYALMTMVQLVRPSRVGAKRPRSASPAHKAGTPSSAGASPEPHNAVTPSSASPEPDYRDMSPSPRAGPIRAPTLEYVLDSAAERHRNARAPTLEYVQDSPR